MELRIDIDRAVVDWLASMGYPVAGMPQELLHGMLLREARQWQLPPEALRALIDEGATQSPQRVANDHRYREGARPRRTDERLVRLAI